MQNGEPGIRIQAKDAVHIQHSLGVFEHRRERFQPGRNDRLKGWRVFGHPAQPDLRQQFWDRVGTLQEGQHASEEVLWALHNTEQRLAGLGRAAGAVTIVAHECPVDE